MSVILMTPLFYKALILQGEIWCSSLLELKELNFFPVLCATQKNQLTLPTFISSWVLNYGAQLLEGWLALNPGFLFLMLKSIFLDNFLCYF